MDHPDGSQNPNIRIVVSQWWGDTGANIWGSDLSALENDAAIKKYTSSVYDFFAAYLNTAGGVDGYDIDYESGNVSRNTAAIMRQIRAQLSRLSVANGGRRFYLTVSPASTRYLHGAVGFLDFVNMQTYAGGSDLSPRAFLKLGLKSTQLLYGICPETDCVTPGLSQVEQAYTANNLAGIHLWRLNSDNYQEEGQVQGQVYNFLHGASTGTSALPRMPGRRVGAGE